MKLYKKIAALVLGAMLLTSCQLIDKINGVINSTSSSSSSQSENPISTSVDLDNTSFCQNAVNSDTNYTSSTSSVMNMSTASSIFAEVRESTVVVNACYVYNSSEYNYITSGFIYTKVDDTYYIVTNASGIFHRYISATTNVTENDVIVIKNGDFEISFDDGKRYVGQFVGSYDAADLAVFAITTSDDIKLPTIGSSDELELGDSVLAIGTPSLGDSLINSLVRGTISGLGRRQQISYNQTIGIKQYTFNVADYSTFQFDAPVNGGMEGGPVVNSAGEIVGVISYKYLNDSSTVAYESLSLATPIDDLKLPIQKIIEDGEFVKPTIGISIADVGPMTIVQRTANNINDEVYSGSYIASISAGSSASKASVGAGEVIVEFNGVEVEGMSQISSQLLRLQKGSLVVMKTVDSSNISHTYNITL